MTVSRSQLYPIARHLFATAALNWLTGNTKVLLMANGYNPNFANQFLSDVMAGAILATSSNIANKTESLGYCSGDTVPFGLIDTGQVAGSLIFYQDTGNPATSPLILFIDTPDVYGLPATLQGFSYYLYQNIVAGGWFRI